MTQTVEASSPGGGDEGTPFPPPLVTETLQHRLITGNISKLGGQRGSLTRCAQRYGAFRSKLTAEKPDAEAIETSKQELSKELNLYKLEITKLILLQKNLEAQVAQNNQMEAEKSKAIEALAEEVAESQGEAHRWQETRKCYMDYENLAKLANANHSQPTSKLKEQISQVQEEIEKFQKEQESVDEVLAVRETQFQLLMQYMLDLKRSLSEEDDSKKER